jgi:hypothetical protein
VDSCCGREGLANLGVLCSSATKFRKLLDFLVELGKNWFWYSDWAKLPFLFFSSGLRNLEE